jgi:hypothetical protein
LPGDPGDSELGFWDCRRYHRTCRRRSARRFPPRFQTHPHVHE